jgi:hypothetical protein
VTVKVIRILDAPTAVLGRPGEMLVERRERAVPTWLRSYDPDYAGGIGFCDFTTDPAEAMRFPGYQEAVEEYRRESAVMPLRDDGKPNRPLTAYSVSIENPPEEPPWRRHDQPEEETP